MVTKEDIKSLLAEKKRNAYTLLVNHYSSIIRQNSLAISKTLIEKDLGIEINEFSFKSAVIRTKKNFTKNPTSILYPQNISASVQENSNSVFDLPDAISQETPKKDFI